MLKELLGRVIANPLYKLLSLALALAAWMYVQQDEVREAKLKASVEWLMADGVMSTEPLPTSVNLSVRGTRAAVRAAEEAIVRVPVDLSEIGVGRHSLEFAAFPVEGLPAGIETLTISPSSVRFVLDEVAVRKAAVRAEWVGEPKAGFMVESVDLDPPVVTLRGPRSVVARLREVSTQPIEVAGLDRDVERRARLELPGQVDGSVDELNARVRVAARVERKELRGVPVHAWGAWGWFPEPQAVRVTLEGPSAELRAIDEGDVAAFAHLPEAPEASRYDVPFGPASGVRLSILHPGGEDVRVVGVQPGNVEMVRP